MSYRLRVEKVDQATFGTAVQARMYNWLVVLNTPTTSVAATCTLTRSYNLSFAADAQ